MCKASLTLEDKPLFSHVPEVLNVHVDESKKKSTFFLKDFFFKQGKINF